MPHVVTMFAVVLVAGGVLAAQDTTSITAGIEKDRRIIQKLLVETAERMPEEHYTFKPLPEVRSFGELVAHVATHQAIVCSTTMGEQKDLKAYDKTTKAEIVTALKESGAICDEAHKVLTDANATEIVHRRNSQQASRFDALQGDISHSWEEYGYMSVYLRLKGIVPPSSDPEFRKTLR